MNGNNIPERWLNEWIERNAFPVQPSTQTPDQIEQFIKDNL